MRLKLLMNPTTELNTMKDLSHGIEKQQTFLTESTGLYNYIRKNIQKFIS